MAASETDDPWKGWADRLRRMGEANRTAEEGFLATLSQEEGLRIFEELCAVDWENGEDDENEAAPRRVALARLWKGPR